MHLFFLAQLDKVNPTFLHQFALLAIGLLGGAAAAASIAGVFLKRKRTVEPQPLQVAEAPKYVSEAFCATRHKETAERLKSVEGQVESLWNTMRAENTSIRNEMHRCFQDIERALGRIEGKIDQRIEEGSRR